MAADLVVRPERRGDALVVAGPEVAFAFRSDALPGRTVEGGDVAAIVALPVAMRLGRPLRIEAPVCPVLRAGLARLAEIWSVWRPDLFAAVPIVGEEGQAAGADPPPALLMAYSGGIDSTHALRAFNAATGLRPDLMTVLGMDYRRADPARFGRLLDKTRPFREAVAGRHHVVDSDAASVMRRFDVESYLGFGFQVMACLHLLADGYGRGLIASDYARYQEVLVGPRGTFTGTNALLSGRAFAVGTLDPDATRGDKVAALASDPLALSALSFCKDYAVRPDNCGVCSKCQRTKAMFHAATGRIPPIFRDDRLDLAHLPGLDLSRPYERVFAQDVLRLARKAGREADFAPLAAMLTARTGPSSLRHRLFKLRKLLASRLGRGQAGTGAPPA